MSEREVYVDCGANDCSQGLVITGNDLGLDQLTPGSSPSCDPGNACAKGDR